MLDILMFNQKDRNPYGKVYIKKYTLLKECTNYFSDEELPFSFSIFFSGIKYEPKQHKARRQKERMG